MENTVFSIINPLLEELKESSYLGRQREIARQLEPFKNEAIPLLKKMLRRRSCDASWNALKVLAIMGDPRAILAMLRYVERETWLTGELFELLVETIKEKDEETRQKINAQLILYLIKGPKTPQPKPFDPKKSQRDLMKSVNALRKVYGVKEMDEEATQMVEDLKEQWSRPPDPAYLAESEKERISHEQEIIMEVINVLRVFNGLQDPQIETVLESYIKLGRFDSLFLQHVLAALSMINPTLATSYLERFIPRRKQLSMTTRVVSSRMDNGEESVDFSMCARENKELDSQERPYSFKFENGMIFFLVRGEEKYKWFIGQAQNKEAAIQAAHQYLEKWIPEIESLNAEKILMNSRVGEYTGSTRYAELAEMLQKHFDFKRRGFQESYISPKHYPIIIYDSEWCRVKFRMYVDGNHAYDQKDYVSVYYGRLHAPNTEEFMTLNGEKCWCWHRDYHFLPFLDGISPQDAANKFSPSQIIENYMQSEYAQNSAGTIKWEIGKQVAIWEHYGQHLFELLDLRHPDLWEEYVQYMTEYERAKNYSNSDFWPPQNKIW